MEGYSYHPCVLHVIHRKVNERLKAQLDKLWHTTNIYMNSPIHEYIEKLTSKLPKHLSVSVFTVSWLGGKGYKRGW